MGVQGETSDCSLGFVDILKKVVLVYKELLVKRNLCFDVYNLFV